MRVDWHPRKCFRRRIPALPKTILGDESLTHPRREPLSNQPGRNIECPVKLALIERTETSRQRIAEPNNTQELVVEGVGDRNCV
jgi:hypothetical protein